MLRVVAWLGVATLATMGYSVQAQNLSSCISNTNEQYYADNNSCEQFDGSGCGDCYQGDMSDPQSASVYNRCVEQRQMCERNDREQRQNCLAAAKERRDSQVASCRDHYQE